MDAIHFRQRAARSRELAQSGDDLHLSRMLLDVALDLDAEADAIEASTKIDRRGLPDARPDEWLEARLHVTDCETDAHPVRIIDLSAGGARFRVGIPPAPGTRVILELPAQDVRLRGTVVRQRGMEAAMSFDPIAPGDADFGRLLLSVAQEHRVRA